MNAVSIIIPTLNEEKYLPSLLSDIEELNDHDLKFEIIIADDNSKDKTRKIAADFGALVVDGGKPGVARNNGAKVAKYSLFLFLDADARLNAGELIKGLQDFEKRELDMAGARFLLTGSLANRINYFFNNVGKNWRQYTKTPMVSGDFMLIKRKVFEKLDGFKDIEIGEDNDLAVRVGKTRYKFRILSGIKIQSSDRRIKRIGYRRFLFAIFLALWLHYLKKINTPEARDRLNKLYGGWGGNE